MAGCKHLREAREVTPSGQGCKECLEIGDVHKVFKESHDYEELKDVWAGWHSIATRLRG